MPQLGLTMTEGAVSTWLKAPGDKIERGEILFLVQTDKVEMEVESFVSGIIEDILVESGATVPVGTVIATVEDGRVSAAPPAVAAQTGIREQEVKTRPVVVHTAAAPRSELAVSPRARKLANSLGVDLTALAPSNGVRITEEDVREFHQKKSSGQASSGRETS